VSVYKLAGAATGGTEDGLAQLDVQFDGVITAISGAMRWTATTNADYAQAEVSFISTNTVGSNDTRGSLFQMKDQIRIGAEGTSKTSVNYSVGGLAIAVNAGERLWLHTVTSTGEPATVDVYIYVEDGQGVQVPNRRR